jgi:hypothetical protein
MNVSLNLLCLFSKYHPLNFYNSFLYTGARGSVVGWCTMLQDGRSPVRVQDELDILVYLILPAALWPCGRLSLEHKWVPGIFLGVRSGRCVGLTTLPPFVSRMSENVRPSTSRNPKGVHGLYRDKFTFLYTGVQSWSTVRLQCIILLVRHNLEKGWSNFACHLYLSIYTARHTWTINGLAH